MTHVRTFLILVFLLVLASCANNNKQDPFMITFHLEGSSIEGQNMVFPEHVGYPPKIKHFRITPEISHHQVASFYPFEAEDGVSHGAVLVMSEVGQRRLFAATSQHTGKILLTKVQGRTADYLLIDGPVRNGMLMISSGISDELLELMSDEENGLVKLSSPPFAPAEAQTQEELFDPLLR